MQTAYYFRTSGLIKAKTGKPSNFIVPTGNFGNVYAAYIAKQMGAPIKRLIVTSNDNDVLPRLFESSAMQGQNTVKTISPSMDIQVSSNFERLLWHIKGNSGADVSSAQKSLESTNRYELSDTEMQMLSLDFSAMRCTEDNANQTMRIMQQEFNKTICPHTATAVHAYLQMQTEEDTETVIVETAHPAKFSDAVKNATGVTPSVPAHASQLMSKKEVTHSVDANLDEIQQSIDNFFAA